MIWESVLAALASIKANSFRSFLTALGIIIGVASVIAVISIVQGLSVTINAQFQGLGSNSVTVRSFTPFKQALQGRLARLTENDLRAIEHRVDGVSHISPVLFNPLSPATSVSHRSKTAFTSVFGVGASWIDVQGLFPQAGRYFTRNDDDRRRLVCLLGAEVVNNLELPEDPIGEFIRIGAEWCRVVGVMEELGEVLGLSRDDYVLLPFNTMKRIIGGIQAYDIQIQMLVDDMERMDELTSRIRRVLRQQHNLRSGQADDFRVH